MRSLAGAVAVLALVLTGCGSTASGAGGFVSGDGVVRLVDAADRAPAGDVAGTTLDGEHLDLDEYAGHVVVLNVWGAWCAPCRAEAPELAQAAQELARDDVAFVGINTRDYDRAAPRAFVRSYDVPYPNLYDPGGVTLLAFTGTISPQAIPSTLVIDRDGRVAASIVGPVPTTQTVVDLAREVAGG